MSRARPVHPELAGVEVHGTTRAAFLMRSTLAVAGAYGAGAVAPFVGRAMAQANQGIGAGDIEILNFALTLEYFEAAYYEEALKQVKLSGEVKPLAEELASNEREHVDFLSGALKSFGKRPVPAPKVDFPYSGEKRFLSIAQTLEDTGVGAYNGAAPQVINKNVLTNAGRIVQVEGRHAAAIRMMRGQPPSDSALDEALTFDDVVDRITPFLDTLPFAFRQPERRTAP